MKRLILAAVLVLAACDPEVTKRREVVRVDGIVTSIRVEPQHEERGTRTVYDISKRFVTRAEPQIKNNVFSKGQHVEMKDVEREETVRTPREQPYVDVIPTRYFVSFSASPECDRLTTEGTDDFLPGAATWSVGTHVPLSITRWIERTDDGPERVASRSLNGVVSLETAR